METIFFLIVLQCLLNNANASILPPEYKFIGDQVLCFGSTSDTLIIVWSDGTINALDYDTGNLLKSFKSQVFKNLRRPWQSQFIISDISKCQFAFTNSARLSLMEARTGKERIISFEGSVVGIDNNEGIFAIQNTDPDKKEVIGFLDTDTLAFAWNNSINGLAPKYGLPEPDGNIEYQVIACDYQKRCYIIASNNGFIAISESGDVLWKHPERYFGSDISETFIFPRESLFFIEDKIDGIKAYNICDAKLVWKGPILKGGDRFLEVTDNGKKQALWKDNHLAISDIHSSQSVVETSVTFKVDARFQENRGDLLCMPYMPYSHIDNHDLERAFNEIWFIDMVDGKIKKKTKIVKRK